MENKFTEIRYFVSNPVLEQKQRFFERIEFVVNDSWWIKFCAYIGGPVDILSHSVYKDKKMVYVPKTYHDFEIMLNEVSSFNHSIKITQMDEGCLLSHNYKTGQLTFIPSDSSLNELLEFAAEKLVDRDHEDSPHEQKEEFKKNCYEIYNHKTGDNSTQEEME